MSFKTPAPMPKSDPSDGKHLLQTTPTSNTRPLGPFELRQPSGSPGSNPPSELSVESDFNAVATAGVHALKKGTDRGNRCRRDLRPPGWNFSASNSNPCPFSCFSRPLSPLALKPRDAL